MNFCREMKTASEFLQIFLGRFQLLPQQCPAALGFKFIVRYVHYHPTFPFTVSQGPISCEDEGEAKRFHQQRIESTFSNISQLTEESREHYVTNMVSEDEQNNWTTQTTYHALLIRYLPKLLPAFAQHLGNVQEPEQAKTPTEVKPEQAETQTTAHPKTTLDKCSCGALLTKSKMAKHLRSNVHLSAPS